MYAKTCEGCSKQFEALKASRRYCSDTCSRRVRRRAAAFPNSSASEPVSAARLGGYPDINPDDADTIAYLRAQIAFVRAFDPAVVLPVDVVDKLLSFEDEGRSAFVEADCEAVERVLVERAIARLEEFQTGSDFEDAQAAMALLIDLWADRVDDRVVSALASALRGSAS